MHRTIEKYLARFAFRPETSDLIVRVAMSLIFIVGGVGHSFRASEMHERIDESPWRELVHAISNPMVLLGLSGAVIVGFGFCLALGIVTKVSAVLLFVTLVPITLSIHVAPGHVGTFLKNVAIPGGLLLSWTKGSDDLALCPDQRSKS